jgi:glycosyltransferase involved in cell wall biosynthesis/tetratricopeptide (TPR) repeat protein
MGLFFWRKKPQTFERTTIDLTLGATLGDDYVLPNLLKEELTLRNLRIDVTLKQAKNLIETWEERHSALLIRDAYKIQDFDTVFSLGQVRIQAEKETDVHICLIRAYYLKKEWNACISVCHSLLSFDTSNLDGYRFLARCAKNKSELDLSGEYYLRLLEHEPNDLDSLLSLVRLHYNANNHVEVIRYANLVIQIAPNERDGHLFLARSYGILADYQTSLKPLLKLLSMNEKDLEALVSIGKALHNLERYNDSMKYLERALTIDPEERRSRRTLALIYDRLGKSEQALVLYTKECIFEPRMFSNWEKKINLLYRLNRVDEAQDCVSQILKLGNSDIDAYLLANEVALSFYWNDSSKELLEDCSQKWGDSEDFFERITTISLKSGELTKTSKYVSQGLKKTPKNKRLLELQTRMMRILEDTDTPPEILKKALSEGEPLLESECNIMNLIQAASKIQPYSITDSKSNVVMVSSSLGRGGAERQVVSCLSGLMKDSKFKETSLYCHSISGSRGHAETYETEVHELGVHIHEIGKRTNWNEGIKDAEILLKPWRKYLEKLPVGMQRNIEPLFLNFYYEKPQIVHAWQDQTNLNASIAALMAGVPGIVMFARSLRPDGKTMMHIRNRPYLRRAYQALFVHAPRVLLCHNSSAGATSYSEWTGYSANDFEIIHNGVDFSAIEAASNGSSVNEIVSIPEDSIVIGGIFRLVIEKRPKLWVEALSKVILEKENVIAIHVGGGSHSESLQAYINELGLSEKIHLVGQTKQIKAWLDVFDLFLLTSVVEGLPNVLIEAQAFGVPVISTDAGGAQDTFINGETGVLVTEPTADTIAQAILNCLNNPEWMKIAKTNSREAARKRFSQEAMIKRLKEIYTLALQRT